jgi:mannose-6-phosphate isomerase-like protein (cupin superfamily)
MNEPPVFETRNFSVTPHERRIEKPWGHEVLLTPPHAPYTAKLIAVRAGKQLSLQVHDVKVETQMLVSGEATLVIEGPDGELREVDMLPGVGYHIAVGQRHRLRARTDMMVFEASSPEAGTTYRLEDDFARPHETAALRARDRGEAVGSG